MVKLSYKCIDIRMSDIVVILGKYIKEAMVEMDREGKFTRTSRLTTKRLGLFGSPFSGANLTKTVVAKFTRRLYKLDNGRF